MKSSIHLENAARHRTDPVRGAHAADDAELRAGAAAPALQAQGTQAVDRPNLHRLAVSTEKDQQVPLMGEIYKREVRTVIWFGAGLPGDAGTPSRANAVVGRLFQVRTVPGRSALSEREGAGWTSCSVRRTKKDRIERICAHEWFQRIWSIQEFSLTETAVFIVDDATCGAALLYTYFVIVEALLPGNTHEQRLFRTRSPLLEALGPDLASSDSDSTSL
ncbi:hypothetical protein DL769_001814 [Monosporascus sp. CRB-8-3]|nr:hypothetical protein DL769_001814 [Monosporascus sp. CRB-8-3]